MKSETGFYKQEIKLCLKCIWDNPDLHIVFVDHLQKIKERMQKFKETGDSRYIYQNELDKTCFQDDMAYRDFKDLTRRTASDEILHDKVFDIAMDFKMWWISKGCCFKVL